MDTIRVDEIGPQKVTHYYSQKTGLRAVVAIDNTALGPAVGGVRVSASVTTEEVMRLARTMTLKNSIAGLPHGGAKAGIALDPHDPQKEMYFRVFARQIKELAEYIPGPDMGSDEACMAWLHSETGRATGLPADLGGLPLDKLGATGFGLTKCAEVACPYAGIELRGARVAIQGFGSVGRAAAKFLAEKGALLVAASDTTGWVFNRDGIDPKELMDAKGSTGSVITYKKATIGRNPGEIFGFECDILIPAATPDVIHKGNAGAIRAKLVLEGANIPATAEAEQTLHGRGVLVVPDFIANAGGVIMAAMEYAKRTEKEAFEAIEAKIKANTGLVLERSKKGGNILPRLAAEAIAKERVLVAMRYAAY